jgi:parallel beta-helix repeat protein
MRTNSSLAVGSPMVRVEAIVLAILLLSAMLVGAGVAGSRLLAAGPIVVAQDGSGTVTTISEAVAMAEDGAEILVKPGVNAESVTISKDITLRGEDRDSVVIEFGHGCAGSSFESSLDCPAGTPLYDDMWWGQGYYAIVLDDVEAELSDLTFHKVGLDSGSAIVVKAGAPLIHDITYTGTAEDDFGNIYIHAGSAAVVRDSDLGAFWVFFEEASPATIENSTFGAIVANTVGNTSTPGGPSTIRNNRTRGIAFSGPALVEGNELIADEETEADFYGSGIDLEAGDGWVIKDNVLVGFPGSAAIAILGKWTGTISSNTLTDNEVGISAGSGDSVIEGNTITGGGAGIILTGGSATVADNVVEGVSRRGIGIGDTSRARLSGNRSCGNGENLFVANCADPAIDDSNEIC